MKVFMYEVDTTAGSKHLSPHQERTLYNYMLKQEAHGSLSQNIENPTLKKMIVHHQSIVHPELFSLSKRNMKGVPPGWTCDPLFYDAEDGCDCQCGAWDPDCDHESKDDPRSIVLNCASGASPQCVKPNGVCSYGQPPSNWFCSDSRYNSSDGCDCGCGAYDPDCDSFIDTPVVTGCWEGIAIGCDSSGGCIYAPPVPSTWICDPMYYGTNDGCDCNCGATDPDCSVGHQPVMNCPCDTMECSFSGFCVGKCNGNTVSVKHNLETEGSVVLN